MEPTKNTNPEQLDILIYGDSHSICDGIKTILTNGTNEYVIRITDDFHEIRIKNKNHKIGVLLVVISESVEWFDKLVRICNDPQLEHVKIILCTNFTDANTHKILKGLDLKGSFKINATRTEIIVLVTAVNNGLTLLTLPEDALNRKKVYGKRNRNLDGTYKMRECLKEVFKLLQQKKEIPEISDLINKKTRTVEGWFRPFRKESGTHNQHDDIEWAITHGHIERII
jgi:hypothetical protein